MVGLTIRINARNNTCCMLGCMLLVYFTQHTTSFKVRLIFDTYYWNFFKNNYIYRINYRTSAQGVLQGLHHGLGRGCGAVIGGK